MDGYLKIKTKLDNTGVDKDIKQLEDKIKKLQIDNANKSKEENSLQKEISKYNELKRNVQEYEDKIKNLQNKYKQFDSRGIFTLPKDIQGQIRSYTNAIAESNIEIDKQEPKMQKIYSKLNKIKAKQTENNTKISEYKQKIEQININKIQNGINNVGKSIQNQVGSLGRMASTIIGIGIGWSAVKRSISLVSQYNEQVSTDLEYMRYCIAQLLVPVVQFLVQLLFQVLSYMNAIMNAWFGVNIFSKSSAENFNKMKKGAVGTSKAVDKIKKSLQGFDEMNILQDNSDGAGGTGAGGISPSMDLSGLQANIPKWLQWIIDNKDLILALLGGIAGAIFAMKLGLDGIKALGIGLLIAGVILFVESLIAYLNDPTWENFGKMIIGIGVAVLGLGVIFQSVPLMVAGAIAVIVGLIVANWDKIKKFLQNGIDWLNGKSEWVKEQFGIVGEAIYQNFLNIIQFILNEWDNIFSTWKKLLDSVIKIFKDIISGDWNAVWNDAKEIVRIIIEAIKKHFENMFNLVVNILKNILNTFISIFNYINSFTSSVFNFIGNCIVNTFNWAKNGVIGAFNAIKDSIVGTINWVVNWLNDKIDRISNIFWDFADNVSNDIAETFKYVINDVLDAIESILNRPIGAINGAISNLNSLPGVNVSKLSTFSFPRLAKGGIIAQPTQAIIGEAGKEAVLPLENNLEYLDVLADRIASKLGNDGDTCVYLDSRLILRQINKRKRQLDFATNGR